MISSTELRTIRLKNQIIIVTTIAPMNAAAMDDSQLSIPPTTRPGAKVSKATASEAPLVTPKMSGAANGLRKAV